MSYPNRRARRELKRLDRRIATDPSRPILRAAERRSPDADTAVPATPSFLHPPGGVPARGDTGPNTPAPTTASLGRQPHENARRPSPGGPDGTVQAAARPQEGPVPPPPQLPPRNDGSTFPLWARLLTLPPDLDPTYRAFLFRYIESTIAPRDDQEHWLAARNAAAMARLHVNAQREPESPSSAWLRYEALADRQLRAAHRDLKAHRAAVPPNSDQQLPTNIHREPANPAQSARPELRAPRPELATAQETDRSSAAVSLRQTEPGCHAHVPVSLPKGGPTVANQYPDNTPPALTPRSPAAPA